MKTERRNYPRRLMAGKDVFVLDHCSGKVGTLRDLSVSGLQLSYPPDQSTCNQWTLIDIFTGERERIVISGLTCEMVYDVASLAENDKFSGSNVRLCGVCFNGLTDGQKDNLNKLLSDVTTA
ncbi:PilZ domain-containing protein [Desulfosarcina sp.]|uniref:PilZ domain-containing protein n=1 Tax=Desulfosarcina sp. TaxID=2027861 RepID=UPI003564BF6C